LSEILAPAEAAVVGWWTVGLDLAELTYAATGRTKEMTTLDHVNFFRHK
jgi:hypothetical protein